MEKIRRDTIVCIAFSLWTILQNSFRLVFVVYGYYLSHCATSPTESPTILFYLTYFYRQKCKKPVLSNAQQTQQIMESVFTVLPLGADSRQSLNLVVEELLNNTDVFPAIAAQYSKASGYFLAFAISDGVWIVAAVSLFMSACCGLKERLSLLFCLPWLIVTALVSLFDVAASIHFGLDIAETSSFSNWLDFVGVSNKTNLQDLDAKSSSEFLSMAPAIAVVAISSRFLIVWIINIVGFFLVLRATIHFSRESFKDERRRKRLQQIHRDSPPIRCDLALDSSAARIANWQLFYGAVEASSSRSDSREAKESENNSPREKIWDEADGSANLPEISASQFYYQFPDVVDSNFCMTELRGQLPWSYTQSTDENICRNYFKEEEMRINNLNKQKKAVRISTDSLVARL